MADPPPQLKRQPFGERPPIPITVRIESERGEAIENFGDYLLAHDLLERASVDTRCLRFVDLYGDAVFNQLQLPVLLAEVTAIGRQLPQERQACFDEFLAFLGRARGVHLYVRFIGD